MKEEKPWYEQDSDGAWYREKKDILKDSSDKGEKNTVLSDGREKIDFNDVFEGDREETNGKKKKREKGEKVYASANKTVLKTDKKENEREYISRNFTNNPAVTRFKKGGKSGFLFMLGILLIFVVLSVSFEEASEFPIAAWIGCGAAFVFFVVLIFLFLKKRNLYKNPDKFFLVAPYAVKAEYGSLHGLNGSYIYSSGTGSREKTIVTKRRREPSLGETEDIISLFDCGLKIYYEYRGKKREAATEKIYSEDQIKRIVNSFREGELIVACRKRIGKKSDIAVICEPFYG